MFTGLVSLFDNILLLLMEAIRLRLNIVEPFITSKLILAVALSQYLRLVQSWVTATLATP
jgi:hypothetical protein